MVKRVRLIRKILVIYIVCAIGVLVINMAIGLITTSMASDSNAVLSPPENVTIQGEEYVVCANMRVLYSQILLWRGPPKVIVPTDLPVLGGKNMSASQDVVPAWVLPLDSRVQSAMLEGFGFPCVCISRTFSHKIGERTGSYSSGAVLNYANGVVLPTGIHVYGLLCNAGLLFAALAGCSTAGRLITLVRARDRNATSRCPNCKYNVSGVDTCPECGQKDFRRSRGSV